MIVLDPITIPESYRLRKHAGLYSADSILDMLSPSVTNNVLEVVGLTHREIYILKKLNNLTSNQLFDYEVKNVFGLADYFGNCCVISDHNLGSPDSIQFKKRLRTVVFHEIGHNIGLDDCSSNDCIMSKQNGNLFNLDKINNDYCNDCKSKLPM